MTSLKLNFCAFSSCVLLFHQEEQENAQQDDHCGIENDDAVEACKLAGFLTEIVENGKRDGKMNGVYNAAAAVHKAGRLALLIRSGKLAERLQQRGPEGEQRREAPQHVDEEQHTVAGVHQMEQAAQAGQNQRNAHQLSRGDHVRDHTAEQIGNHTEYAEHGAEHTHLSIGQIVGFQICIIIVGSEIWQAVDHGTGYCDQYQSPDVSL